MIRIQPRVNHYLFEKDGEVLRLDAKDCLPYVDTINSMLTRATLWKREVRPATATAPATEGDAPEYAWEQPVIYVHPDMVELNELMPQPFWWELGRSDHYFGVIKKWPRVKVLTATSS